MSQKTSTASTLHIFRAGTHTAMGGQRLAFSESDLQACASAYDPTLHEAPIVVGHPSTDGPAYGWIKGLKFCDGLSSDDAGPGLHALPQQVNPEFADLVAAGAYKKISAAFYAPGAPNNPVPGVYYLRHVGFLGAQAPSVKGLRSPEFADAEEGVVTFSEWDDVNNASLWRSLRDWIIGKFGQDEADRVIPPYQVQSLEQGAADEMREAAAEASGADSAAMPQGAFSEPKPMEHTVTPEEKAALEARNTQLSADLAAARSQLAQARSARLHADNAAFCESLPVNKLLPAWRPLALATLDHFATQDAPLEFGEGDEKEPLLEAFKAFLKALPEQVAFGEAATKARAGVDDAAAVAFAAPQGFAADPVALELHQRACGHVAAHGGNYLDAVRALSA